MIFRFGKKQYIGDAAIAVFIIALCFLPIFFTSFDGKTTKAEVQLDGKTAAIVELSKETVMSPNGGKTMVRVSGGRAYIESSDCRDGVCTKMHGVDSNGGSAVCVPNKVSVLPYNANKESVSADVTAG